MLTRSRLVSEWDAFLKGHDDFSRKKPKDGISGPTRREYGIHLPTQHLVPGWRRVGGVPLAAPFRALQLPVERGCGGGSGLGPAPRMTRGSGSPWPVGLPPSPPPGVCFPAVVKDLDCGCRGRHPRPRLTGPRLGAPAPRFRWLAPPSQGLPPGVCHQVVLCVCYEANPTLFLAGPAGLHEGQAQHWAGGRGAWQSVGTRGRKPQTAPVVCGRRRGASLANE